MKIILAFMLLLQLNVFAQYDDEDYEVTEPPIEQPMPTEPHPEEDYSVEEDDY
jgi:hypothetical protein